MMTTSSDLKEISQDLQKAFLSLQSSEECFAFLKDLMTEKEIKELSQRLDIAQRLHHKESYKYIYAFLGVSSTTIARVGKSLHSTQGGYRCVLERIDEKSKE